MADRPHPLEALGDSADGLFVVDDRQRIVRWNAGAERLLGYKASDVLQRKCHDIARGCYPDGRPLCGDTCPVHSSVARGELPKGVDCSLRAKNHRLVPLHLSLIVIPHQPTPLVAHVLRSASGQDRVGDRAPATDDGALWRTRIGFAFTPREQQVLRLLAEGLSNARIAPLLGVSPLTIRNHVQHILTKCGAHSRAEAVSFAFLSRLL